MSARIATPRAAGPTPFGQAALALPRTKVIHTFFWAP